MDLIGYEVITNIYESARSEVYRAISVEDGKPVILKALKEIGISSACHSAFKHEFTITRSLRLDCVIKALNLLPYENRLVIVFEDFGGESLDHYIDKKKLPMENFLRIAIQITDAVGKIHAAGITHKDINPSNIIVNPQTEKIQIIDFGISTALSWQKPVQDPPAGLRGTLAYMSPEQTGRINRTVDYRSDFYSLGVTFYEMLCNRKPFISADSLDLVHAHIAKMPQSPIEVDSKIPEPVSNLIMKLLCKNAEDRYQSSKGIRKDLETCLKCLKRLGRIDSFDLGHYDISDKLHIPGVIFGRGKETEIVSNTFQRVANGERKILFLSGAPGIGKTALIRDWYKSAIRKMDQLSHIRFIYGKFDRFQQNIPYSAVVNAFRELVRQLVSESDKHLDQWRETLLSALGPSGLIITEVIPELELIIGPQSPLPALGPIETQNRFNLVFQKFIRSICQSKEPLTIFLDDLQWADTASLKLIELIMSDPKLHYLFLVIAYRDNEVASDSPLMRTMESMEKSHAGFEMIQLKPLDEDQTCKMIAQWLVAEEQKVVPLAKFIFQKAEGNPFYSEIFLKSLYAQRLLLFNSEKRQWTWELEQLQDRGLMDNVFQLIENKILQLKPETKKVLQQAACIGNRFELQTLARICDMSIEDTAASLQEAVADGLVLPLGDTCSVKIGTNEPIDEYVFIHDRIQQVLYQLIDRKSRTIAHQQVGRHFLESSPTGRKDDRIFDIVNQMNLGQNLLVSQYDCDELAALNLKAGQKAKTSAAFEPALKYFQTGIHLLDENGWQRQYDMALALHVEASEAAYLCAAYPEMQKLVSIVLQNANCVLDKVQVHKVQIDAFKSQYKLQSALQAAKPELNALGVKLPAKAGNFHILKELAKARVFISKRKIAKFVDLPNMTDPRKLASVQLMMRVSSAAYFADTKLFPLIIIKAVIFSVRHGNAAESSFVYAVYGLILCGVIGDITSGDQFGQLALKLLEKYKADEIKARTYFMVSGFIMHWTRHIRETLDFFAKAFEVGQETGDFEYASYSGLFHSLCSLISGRNLEEIDHEMDILKDTLVQLNHEPSIHMHDIYHQTVQNLAGKTTQPTALCGAYYDEQHRSLIHLEANDRTTICNLYFFKLYLHFLFGEYPQAAAASELASKYLDGIVGTPAVPLFYFYDSLSSLAMFSNSDKTEQKRILKKVKANQKKMKKWSHYAPMNYSHKYFLVQAEIYRILNKKIEAGECFEHAIALAQENGFINETALAHELAGNFYLGIGKNVFAGAHLAEAQQCYRKWGAFAKASHISKHHSHLFQISSYENGNMDNAEDTVTLEEENLDLAAVMKASQAISSEVFMASLLKELMNIIIANAGAQRGFLILIKEGRLKVEASVVSDPPTINVLQSIPIEDNPLFSLDIVRYVFRSAEGLVIENGVESKQFESDEYIVKYAPKSILCMPIRQKDTTSGVLYLENNLTTSAFTEERIKILRILLSQAAISIENARLYENLKQEIIDRKQAQDDLLHLATAIEQAAEGIIITEKDGTVRYSNPAFEKITGYKQIDIRGQSISVLRTDKYDEKFYKKMMRAIMGGNVWSGRLEAKNINGSSCQLEVTFSPVRDGSNHVISFVAVYRDVSREIQMEKELRQSQKMEAIGTLAGGIAHDFNNILSAILGYTEISIFNLPETSPVHKQLKEVLKACERAKKLVGQILSFSRQNELEMKPIYPAIIVKEALNLMRASLPSTIDICTQINARDDMVMADPTQIHQVIMNLCTNAAHAMRRNGGTLEIGLFSEHVNASNHQVNPGNYLKLIVKDTGHGIEHTLIGRIFEPFFTTKEPGQGTGMGLAVVHGIVQRMGGYISVESQLNSGTTFQVLLPIHKKKVSAEKEIERTDLSTGKGKILFIDDEEQIIDIGQQILKHLGYNVVTNRSSQSGLRIFKEQSDNFDLIITDLTMPKMTGIELAKACKSIRPDIPIILCSGYSDGVTKEEAHENGIRAFIKKPFSMQNMSETIKVVMNEKKQFLNNPNNSLAN